ncbi:bifunctional methylenetetrahydrofolate dehydrogenase/methenyltetrahydrofolate cyclohydrolase FolD [Mesorhizobium sp. BR1-1-3]|jgi:methylenetetrahydrofolate dehydrogenase (NADP+)/methenyltetrahydrofolate cyclohydrolase|uniref:bifunctional methylenetetrahydrofolate dehydrogenase/methenyltetrahydrofolate cyclohydrolase FolD n=1 Tax=unclassified Mesorhizobium TaxID=325217 RepID=UPI000F750A96|nr:MULTISPECIES: bifunctional methylenetetrahydrofolate dehydrogenase/methenyltetrahydrofolate cyclohydrolase FolD [unclassified Mesorhizobium]AZO45244.1 bifunctional methylenetetrahydrofolate dehydrogenase/methenyltetrahydrofolate cyclohydrolase FolD [Mesorhizobium sp. M7D.F.Ca.US.005.01.1.1]MBZ9887623.1 bifunctional methylenetetrahydrofolate dehydrogenase/methenyltetrahydrofolate cyclohydrolase FolD [Mesorhizobium sp. BR1-1-3]
MREPVIISGAIVAASILERVKLETEALKSSGINPGLAVVIVGSDPASQVYVSSKGRKAEECGFLSRKYELPEITSEKELLGLVHTLNEDPKIHGLLLQLPLPKHLDAGKIIQAISPDKDVDGFHYVNVGMLGTGELEGALVPCTPAGAMLLIESVRGKDLSGLTAVVIGRSNIVGKPMANLLLASNATVTIAHSRTAEIEQICRGADILVAAVGKPDFVKGDWIKPGATVIDIGINRLPAADGTGKGRLVGDVDFEDACRIAGAITPVPGGVGPMTIAMLMANTLKAAQRSAR